MLTLPAVTEHVAAFFRFLDNLPFILSFSCLGLCLKKTRPYFYHALYLMFLSLLIKAALKCFFEIPNTLQLGYAYPSGHMQLAVTFYGFLALQSREVWVKLLVAIILFGIGFSLIHFKYHTMLDILGAVCFSSILLSFDQILRIKKVIYWREIYALIGTFSLGFIAYHEHFSVHRFHWIVYCALISLLIIAPKKICAQSRN